MRSFHNLPPRFIEIKDEALNIYQVSNGDNVMEVRQPRRSDSGKYRIAWRGLSNETILAYKRKYCDWSTYEPKYRVNQPLYHGEIPGFMPIIMEVDGKIVGFADLMFNLGKHFPYHKIPESDIGASIALCIIDKYQGLGFGSYFAEASQLIARHKGAQWALGYTKMTGGMYNIRNRQGWETVSTSGGYAVIKMSVVPRIVEEIKAKKKVELEKLKDSGVVEKVA